MDTPTSRSKPRTPRELVKRLTQDNLTRYEEEEKQLAFDKYLDKYGEIIFMQDSDFDTHKG